MSMKIIGYKYDRKEGGTISTTQKVFERISTKRQFSIQSYRIDLYFPEYKLAIQCDEHDHKYRDINYEIRRQTFIEDQLNSKFICYNPDAEDFTIEKVWNTIFQCIYLKHSSQPLQIIFQSIHGPQKCFKHIHHWLTPISRSTMTSLGFEIIINIFCHHICL